MYNKNSRIKMLVTIVFILIFLILLVTNTNALSMNQSCYSLDEPSTNTENYTKSYYNNLTEKYQATIPTGTLVRGFRHANITGASDNYVNTNLSNVDTGTCIELNIFEDYLNANNLGTTLGFMSQKDGFPTANGDHVIITPTSDTTDRRRLRVYDNQGVNDASATIGNVVIKEGIKYTYILCINAQNSFSAHIINETGEWSNATGAQSFITTTAWFNVLTGTGAATKSNFSEVVIYNATKGCITTNQKPSTPTNLTANSGVLNNTFSGTITMLGSGSTDPDGDLFNYSIEYGNITQYNTTANQSVILYYDNFSDGGVNWNYITSPYQILKNISNFTNSGQCFDDADDECIRFNGTGAGMRANITLKTSLDLSNCFNGTANIYIGKVAEVGTLEPVDCVNVSYSSNGGTTWYQGGSALNVFCDDAPTATKLLTIPSSNYTNNFKFAFIKGGFAGVTADLAEAAYLDTITVNCTINYTSISNVTNFTRIGSHLNTSNLQWNTAPYIGEVFESFRVQAIDNNSLSSPHLTFSNTNFTVIQATDTSPTISAGFNLTSLTLNQVLNFSCNLTDDIALSTANITINYSIGTQKINFTVSSTSANIFNVTNITGVAGDVLNFSCYATDSINQVHLNSTLFTVQAVVTDDCTCPSSGDWVIDDGSICTLTNECNLGTNILNIENGEIHIEENGILRASKCMGTISNSKFIGNGLCSNCKVICG